MKKKIFGILTLVTGIGLLMAAPWRAPLTPGVASLAANSTNTTAGATLDLGENFPTGLDVYVTEAGTAGTTNGSYGIFFEFSPDNVTWSSSAVDRNYNLSMSTLGAATNTVHGYFANHSRYMRIGRQENTFAGTVNNLGVSVSGQTTPPR